MKMIQEINLVILEMFLLSLARSYDMPSSTNENNSSHYPIIGSVINILPRYGYAGMNMRVLPRNDNKNWIFVEPSKTNIFDMRTIEVREQRSLLEPIVNNTMPSTSTDKTPVVEPETQDLPSTTGSTTIERTFHNEFDVQICDDLHDLSRAYFQHFQFEGFDKPWHVFDAGWGVHTTIKYFGIEPIYTNDAEFFYLFIRLSMRLQVGQSFPSSNMTISNEFKHVLDNFKVGDTPSANNFFNTIGTHYISSYSTGNSIYQVFVYDRFGYEAIKAELNVTKIFNDDGESQSSTISYYDNQDDDQESGDPKPRNNFNGRMTSKTLAALYYYVRSMGKIMILNSRQETLLKIREKLLVPFNTGSNSSIFKLWNNPTLVHEIESDLSAESEGLVSLELKNISPIFGDDDEQKAWFLESLQNTLNLWEVNL